MTSQGYSVNAVREIDPDNTHGRASGTGAHVATDNCSHRSVTGLLRDATRAWRRLGALFLAGVSLLTNLAVPRLSGLRDKAYFLGDRVNSLASILCSRGSATNFCRMAFARSSI